MKFKYIIGTASEVGMSVPMKQALSAFKRGENIAISLKMPNEEVKIIPMRPSLLNNFRTKTITLNRMKIHCFIQAHRKLKSLYESYQ